MEVTSSTTVPETLDQTANSGFLNDVTAPQALFTEAQLANQASSTIHYVVALTLVFVAIAAVAFFMNKNSKKKSKYIDEEYNHLNDYILLKA